MIPAIEKMLRSTIGSAAIEFALAMIPLAILLTGGITYAGVFATKLALSHAVNEGARAGIAGISTCERESLAIAATQAALTIGNPEAASITANVTDSELSVTVDYLYIENSVTPVLVPIPDTLSATAVTITDDPVLASVSC